MGVVFGRTYRLDIFNPQGKHITIEPPFSIRFKVKRDTLASVNKAQIVITNLGPSTRNQIFKDRYALVDYWKIILQAGYEGITTTIFQGNMYEAYSVKEGTEWSTSIEAFDGMYAVQNGYISATAGAGTDAKTIAEMALAALPELGKVVMGGVERKSNRGAVLLGSPMKAIEDETGIVPYIDNEDLYVITDDEAIVGSVIKLDSSLLLETPKRRETFLTIKTLFQPKVQIGRVYEIESKESIYNGQYKVMGLEHDVEISGAKGARAITTLQLYYGAAGFKDVA